MGFFVNKMSEKVRPILHDGEKVVYMFKQSLLNDIAPTFIIATDQRLIIINNSFWGLYTGINLLTPTDYNYIPYNKVAGVVLVRGKLFATLDIRLLGAFESNMNPQKKTEGEVDGLIPKSAITLEKFVQEQIKRIEGAKPGSDDRPMRYASGHFKK